MEEDQTVIMEHGTGAMKVGFGGEEAPKACIPMFFGRGYRGAPGCVAYPGHGYGEEAPTQRPAHIPEPLYVGESALVKRMILRQLGNPLHPSGLVNDWEALEKIWRAGWYEELRVAPEEHPLVMTVCPFTSAAEKQKMNEIIFETYNVPLAKLDVDAGFAVYTSGRTTGCIVDIGENKCRVTPVEEGKTGPTKTVTVGSVQLVHHALRLFKQMGYLFDGSRDDNAYTKTIKDELCEVSPTPILGDLYTWLPEPGLQGPEVEFPSGVQHKFHLQGSQWAIPEGLFRPSCVDEQGSGLSQVIFDSIMACDRSLRPKLFSNIVVCGGGSKFKGLKTRLQNDIYGSCEKIPKSEHNEFLDRLVEKDLLFSKLPHDVKNVTERYFPPPARIQVYDDSEFCVFQGASCYSELPEFQTTATTIDQYNEIGRGKLGDLHAGLVPGRD